MATVIRLTATSGATIGCMNKLYQGVQNLGSEYWQEPICKTMVLNPRNPLAVYCQNLVINVDDSGSEITYWCSSVGRYCYNYSSQYKNLRCGGCGGGTTTERMSGGSNVGAFMQGGVEFIISDDLRIRRASPAVLAQLVPDDLRSLSEAKQLRETSVDVCKDEVLGLLACSMVSESPLSDFFLSNKGGALSTQKKAGSKLSSSIATAAHTTPEQNPSTTLNLKVTSNKSTNKILFAEATDEFFDFLCSFLTTPLGSVTHVLDGHSGLKCIDNLYMSVLELEDKWFLSCMKYELQNPKIAPYHNCKKQPLKLEERVANTNLINPRPVKNFALQPSVFMVPDDLEVKPLSLSTSFHLMREVKVDFSEIEEQTVTVGMKEALSLLKAALKSPSSALTDGLGSFLQKHKS